MIECEHTSQVSNSSFKKRKKCYSAEEIKSIDRKVRKIWLKGSYLYLGQFKVLAFRNVCV